MKKSEIKEGFKFGIPIGLGYLSVSFSFGMLCSVSGLPTIFSVLISMTNMTSAGQVAGLMAINAGSSLLELALCQLVINLRYSLMSLTISQRLAEGTSTADRLFISFGMTDEIFAVMASRKEPITKSFFLGLLILPYIGWSLGTLLGACLGSLLPEWIAAVLSIALYGMFLAIIIPPSKHSKGVLWAVSIAAGISCIIYFTPFLSFISSGISVIICAITASLICAALFPITKQEEEDE